MSDMRWPSDSGTCCSMKSSLLLWAACTVLGAVGLAAIHRPALESATSFQESATKAQARSQTASSDTARIERMQDQVTALQAQVAGLKHRSAHPQAPAEHSPVGVLSIDARRHAEQDARRHAAYIAGVQSAFQLERVDPAWASSTTSRVWNAIERTDAMREAAHDVQCRSSMCRIEVGDDGSGKLHKQLPLWAQQFADALPRMTGQVVEGRDGQSRMVLYLMGPELSDAAASKH
ncbi:hypothetical protein [Lysobacter antibioticus]|uniref:hypothetical protein n=1 Tax=Lysobacter antibioticus TaxID=84531 RepID=UPI001187517B|nr:hypothetical protein [Lysobacter antibioticus]